MSKNPVSLETLVSLAKRRGFIYQGSEIYGGLAGTWDYGPLGVQLKRNIVDLWWKMFVEDQEGTYGIDASILMPEKVFENSGHLAGFKDPMVTCENCHASLRADQVKDEKCSSCGKSGTLSKPRMFNMMFRTQVGALEGKQSTNGYLRPETAQGIFTNFKNVVDSFSPDMPFGIAQAGKAFRNEISPRDFLFRAREFEQMEVEYFIKPDEWEKYFEEWVKGIYHYLQALGIPKESIHEVEVSDTERAHYSKRTIDFEFDYPFGRAELLGLAYRTDYDLRAHSKSGKKLEYEPKDGGESFIPHVIEPSFGVDRLILAILSNAYTEDVPPQTSQEVSGGKQAGEKRVFLKLPASIAPVKVAVFPLLKNKPELVEKAREVYKILKSEMGVVAWDDNGNVGKRYRRQDEIGTPYCVTVDFDSLEDKKVTVRDRDTTNQERIAIDKLPEYFATRL